MFMLGEEQHSLAAFEVHAEVRVALSRLQAQMGPTCGASWQAAGGVITGRRL